MFKKKINQFDLISRSKYLIKNQNEDSLIYSPLNCIISWSPNHLGNIRLKSSLGFFNKLKYLYAILRGILVLGFIDKFFLYNFNQLKQNANTILFSWCKITDFDDFGSFNDRYFRINSKETKNLTFFLISLDNKLPKKIDKNIIILSQIKHIRDFKILRPFKFFLKHVSKFKNYYFDFYKYWNIDTIFAKELVDIFEKKSDFLKINKLILPYEAQNWQHAICSFMKSKNPNIETIGYLHSSPNALPTEYLYRLGAPDKLIVHGSGIKNLLVKHLNWSKNKISVQNSSRYLKNDKLIFNSKIFLPHSFSRPDIYLKKLDIYFANCGIKSIPILKVRNHPAPSSEMKSLRFEDEINKLLQKHSKIFDKNNKSKLTIMIGATAAIVEGLERGCKIIHISNDEVFEVMQKNLWEGLDIIKIDNGIYHYELLKNSHYIKLGTNNTILKEFIKKT